MSDLGIFWVIYGLVGGAYFFLVALAQNDGDAAQQRFMARGLLLTPVWPLALVWAIGSGAFRLFRRAWVTAAVPVPRLPRLRPKPDQPAQGQLSHTAQPKE